MFDVTLIKDDTVNGVRKTTFMTCPEVCSELINIETEGDTIRSVQYVKGCHGNTQGINLLVKLLRLRQAL